MILFDTDMCIEVLRKNSTVIEKRNQTDDSVGISFMTVAELYYGAEKSAKPEKNVSLVEEFLLTVDIFQTDMDILARFGSLKTFLYNENLLLPDADIFIASTAYTKADKLVTGNVKHFTRFPNLVVENWR